MNNPDYSATIIVNKSPEEVFSSISNFRGWWSEEIEGNTNQEGEEFFYHYKDIHLCKIKLIEKKPNTKLVYQVLENEFSFIEDKKEWKDTFLVFDIAKEEEQTKIIFTHKGLVPQYECYEICQESWTNYITNSLYKYLTTGQGEPNPKEGNGFNAQITEKWKIN